MKHKTPWHVWIGGPVALVAYHLTLWLLEHDPEHWLIRGLKRAASWVEGLTTRL